ncbi:hypothetical protein NL676_012025 [Syzygium grande]|nr:hypothetical protein NL676_012025 [Syzygium grande]
MLISCRSLKVLCALNCPDLEGDANFSAPRINGKSLLAHFTDIFEGIASLFANITSKGRTVFCDWRNSKETPKSMDEIMTWLEGILSHLLLQSARSNPPGLEDFWLRQGAPLLFNLMQSSQEDVQERAASGLAELIVIDDRRATIRGCESKVFLAIANLFANVNVAKAIVEEGGIQILTSLTRSMNRLVAQVAAGGLWNLSAVKEHKGAITEAGGVKALVDLIFKWSQDYHILECAAGALGNLVSDDKCRMEVALADGVQAVIMLACNCKFEGVQKQVAQALANFASQQCGNGDNAAVGQRVAVMEALVQLTRSPHEVVGLKAADSLWNLSFDDRNREAIASAGGVCALVTLAKTCLNASPLLQMRVARALWGLAVSKAYSLSIGLDGGVAPLIEMARSIHDYVRGAAIGAICNIVFVPINAVTMVEQGGLPVLVQLCSSSTSKTIRFMATLALAFMFDGSMDEQALVGTSSERSSNRRMAFKQIKDYVLVFSDQQDYTAAAASSAPVALAEGTGHFKCRLPSRFIRVNTNEVVMPNWLLCFSDYSGSLSLHRSMFCFVASVESTSGESEHSLLREQELATFTSG